MRAVAQLRSKLTIKEQGGALTGRADSLKISVIHSLMTTYRMRPLLARSVLMIAFGEPKIYSNLKKISANLLQWFTVT